MLDQILLPKDGALHRFLLCTFKFGCVGVGVCSASQGQWSTLNLFRFFITISLFCICKIVWVYFRLFVFCVCEGTSICLEQIF